MYSRNGGKEETAMYSKVDHICGDGEKEGERALELRDLGRTEPDQIGSQLVRHVTTEHVLGALYSSR